MGIAGVGLIINIIGTIVFAIVGVSHGHSHSHGHGHGPNKLNDSAEALLVPEREHEDEHEEAHEHSHEQKKEKKNKNHSHKHDKEHKHKHKNGHGHEHSHKKKLSEMDLNTWAVFIHFLGDAISSLFVLATGLLLHFFQTNWTKYLDPAASMLIVVLITVTTIPLVKRCSMILLQSVPSHIDLDSVRDRIGSVDGVIAVHDLHVWQLVDGMVIASVHLLLEEGYDVGTAVYQVKQIFHAFGIHSSAIQPEFIKISMKKEDFCRQNCVEECEADWCCKDTAEKTKDLQEHYSTFNEPV